MASREERMQQRLRGAQRRQVKEVDFGLLLPIPTAPVDQSIPRAGSPHIEIPHSDLDKFSSSRKPSSHHRIVSPTGNYASEILTAGATYSGNDANTSAKRRKLDSDAALSTSSRTTRSSHGVPRNESRVVPQDTAQYQVSLANTLVAAIQKPVVSAATPELETDPLISSEDANTPVSAVPIVDEVTASPDDAPGSGQRVRTALDYSNRANSQLQPSQERTTAVPEAQTLSISQIGRRRITVQNSSPGLFTREVYQAPGPVLIDEDLDELSPEQTISKRMPLPGAHTEDASPTVESSLVQEEVEQEMAEEIDDERAASALRTHRTRRISSDPEAGVQHGSVVPESLRPPGRGRKRMASQAEQTTVKQRQPKQPSINAKVQATTKSKTKTKIRAGNPIPVVVHRLIRTLLFDEEEIDADILNSEIPQSRRAGVNTIDVLSQVCQEMVEMALDTLEEGGNTCRDAALRREYKTKWHAVSAFGRELQSRLLEHTINLDNSFSLRRRLREEQKKKIGLREEILRIRAEREHVALRMDEVRIRHEREKVVAEGRNALNSTVHDVELAVELGKSNTHSDQIGELVGTELLLKRVAGEVSSIGTSGGGLLQQIKDFNAFLERTAIALENRKT